MEEIINKTVTENPDSLAIGSASKEGVIKVYGDFSNKEEFKKKIDNAKEIKEYAQKQFQVNS